MGPKLLVVEDSPDFQLMIRSALGPTMELDLCGSIADARFKISKNFYDLVLLDIVLPDGSGFDFCGELLRTERTQKTPVIFLSGKSASEDKVLGLNLGAEDYVTKPFDPAELKARIENKLRRAFMQNQNPEEMLIERGPLKMDLPNYSATFSKQGQDIKLDLTPIEYKLLYRLARQPSHILTRQQLIDGVWGVGAFIEDRSVDKHISSLRRKMGDFSSHLRTVSGMGYQFVIVPR